MQLSELDCEPVNTVACHYNIIHGYELQRHFSWRICTDRLCIATMAGEFKQVSFQSLECPVCLNIFSDPKILSCSHTYCKACLERLVECRGDDPKLICPVCRAETQVPNQDVNQLQTSLALKSLVDDVKNQHQCCTHCKSEEKPQAVVFCQDCGKYLCVTCHNVHSLWEDFSDHVVLAMSEITSGKITVRRYRKCRKHPKENEEYFCSNCKMFVCFRCGVMEHKDQGHCVIEASVYESSHMKNVEDLKSKAEKKQNSIQKYIDFITEEKECVSNTTKQCIDDINKAYEESVQQLAQKKELLIDEVKGRNEKVEKELDRFKELAQQQITHMTTITDLVAKGTKIPLDTDAQTAHDTLCQELQDALRQEDPDYKQPQQSSKKGKCVAFERKVKLENLGEIVESVVKIIELPTKDSMNVMAPTPDGRMAVGCNPGGIKIFSADGKLQQTVLKDVQVFELDFLSDGRYVVQDHNNEIALYTPECDEKLDVRFETSSKEEYGFGCLAVDGDNLIYVGYREAKKIQVFSPVGRKAIREIPCNEYPPEQITCYEESFIIKHAHTVAIIDKDGKVKHKATKSNIYPFATVTQEKAIMVAWVKHNEGLVTIEEYTNELVHIKTLISNYKIEKPEKRKWYYIQEFRSGEIGFCTPDRLYIFYNP